MCTSGHFFPPVIFLKILEFNYSLITKVEKNMEELIFSAWYFWLYLSMISILMILFFHVRILNLRIVRMRKIAKN